MTTQSDGNSLPASAVGAASGQLPRAQSDSPKLPPGKAIENISQELRAAEAPSGFLPAAEYTLLAASDEFTGKLGVDAIRIARERSATAVDREDVLAADKRLRGSNKAERRSWLLGLAGVAGGAAVAAVISLLLTSEPVKFVGFWWLAIGILGLAAFVLFTISYPRRGRKV